MLLNPSEDEASQRKIGFLPDGRVDASSFPRRTWPEQTGFTLVELVTVLVIMGIIAAAAMPRFFDNDVFLERGAANQIMSALRYGQKVAIAQHRNVVVTISAAADSDCIAELTGVDVGCVISDSVAVVPALPVAVTFSALGRPDAAASMVVGTTVLTTINVEAETGYVR